MNYKQNGLDPEVPFCKWTVSFRGRKAFSNLEQVSNVTKQDWMFPLVHKVLHNYFKMLVPSPCCAKSSDRSSTTVCTTARISFTVVSLDPTQLHPVFWIISHYKFEQNKFCPLPAPFSIWSASLVLEWSTRFVLEINRYLQIIPVFYFYSVQVRSWSGFIWPHKILLCSVSFAHNPNYFNINQQCWLSVLTEFLVLSDGSSRKRAISCSEPSKTVDLILTTIMLLTPASSKYSS